MKLGPTMDRLNSFILDRFRPPDRRSGPLGALYTSRSFRLTAIVVGSLFSYAIVAGSLFVLGCVPIRDRALLRLCRSGPIRDRALLSIECLSLGLYVGSISISDPPSCLPCFQ